MTPTRRSLVLGLSSLLVLAIVVVVLTTATNDTKVAAQGAPGTVQQATPTNGATGQSPTLTLTWNAPTGAITGTTMYTVSIWAANAPPAGHLLGDLPATTSLSAAVPVAEQLFPGQTYYWNVVACNGANCSSYNSTWFAFTIAPQAPVTASGAIETQPANSDFAGVPTMANTVPGWTGTATANASYVPNVQSLESTTFALDYNSLQNRSWFRIGYRLPSGAGLTVKFGTTTVFTSSTGAGDPAATWLEQVFYVPAAAGASGTLKLEGTTPYPDIAYVERVDGPAARGVPRLGMTLDPRIPKPLSATSGGGVDLFSGAYQSTVTDLSLAGLRQALSFTRAYSNQAVTATVAGTTLTSGPLGPKWTHNWQYSLKVVSNNKTVALQTPGGGQYAFNYTADCDCYVGPVGMYASLYKDSATQYTLTTHDSTFYLFQNGRLTEIEDYIGNITTLTYDGSNRLTTVTDPGGRTLTLAYNAQNRIQSVTDSTSRSVSYTYDATSGDLTGVTDVRTGTVGYQYGGHWLTQGTDQRTNLFVRNTFDQQGRVTTQRDAANNDTTVQYATPSAGVTTLTDQLTHASKLYFDVKLRLTDVVDATTYTVSLAYDQWNSNLATVSDRVGFNAAYTYDENDNVLTATDSQNHTVSYTYSSDYLRVLTATDPNNRLTTNTYDTAGNLTSTKDNLNNKVEYTPNALGLVTAIKDARGNTVTHGYNATGDLTSITYPSGPGVSITRDGMGRRTQMTDGTGTTTYSYNAANLLTSVTFPGSRTVGYGYDAANNRTSVTYPGGTQQVQSTYDAKNRLATVTDWNMQATSYTYDAADRLTITTLPSGTGVTSSYTYDNANRPTGVTHTKGMTTLASASYMLDSAGKRMSMTTGAGTESYTYDSLDRLTSATYAGGGGTTSYTYDPIGNRPTQVSSSGTTSYTYDTADRLTSVTPPGSAAIPYTFDADGQRTGRGSDTFTWDAARRMTSATVGGQTTSYTYSGDGLRQTRSVGMTTTTFTWDIGRGLPTVLDDGAKYVYGRGLLAQVSGSGTMYYLADGLGSTVAMVDGTGAVVQTYGYDVFGAVRTSTGSQANEYQFAGQQTDPNGLQYLRARYYDAANGRLLSKDRFTSPNLLGQGRNRYAYVANGPTLRRDPSGNFCFFGIGDCDDDSPVYIEPVEPPVLIEPASPEEYCAYYGGCDNDPSGCLIGTLGGTFGGGLGGARGGGWGALLGAIGGGIGGATGSCF